MQAVTACVEEQPDEVEEVLKLFGGDAWKVTGVLPPHCPPSPDV
jgi:hypothetical protein